MNKVNRLEMIHQDPYIEIYVKSDSLSTEYYMTDNLKVLARYQTKSLRYMTIEVKNVSFEHLKKFHEVVTEYIHMCAR